MGHLSENVIPLKVVEKKDILRSDLNTPSVEFIFLPYYENLNSIFNKDVLYNELFDYIEKCNHNSIIVIASSPIFTADFCSTLNSKCDVKLWIAVKLETPTINEGELIKDHGSIVVITKTKKALIHTKTRIGYTFCPSCDKTTKDYGGKKHLYHEYGTLMSDVWKDISINFNDKPSLIIERLQDLFGTEPYQNLNYFDLRLKYPNITIPYEFKIYQQRENTIAESLLINEDCLIALSKIPDNSIDFAFSDPPYNVNKKYENWNDGLDILEYFEWCDNWLSEMARVLKPGRTLAVLNIPQWCIRHFKHLNTILDFQDWIVWEGLSLPVRMIMPAHYSILCFTKGEPRNLPGLEREKYSDFENIGVNALKQDYCIRSSCIKKRKLLGISDHSITSNLWGDIHRLKHNSRRVDHPCQLPPSFMYRLISLFTNENEVILDPFNGAGTSSLAIEQMNRKYIAIELSEYYHGITKKRHDELQIGLDPFRKSDKTPKTKNSRVARVKQQKYTVSKKVLQLEIRDISKRLGRIPKREDVIEYSNHPIEFFDEYFSDWGEVTAAARTTGMSENRIPINES